MVHEILRDPRARAVIEKHAPGATNHPMIYQAMYMSLGEAVSYPESGISPQQFAAIVADLGQLDQGVQ
jgi:hypothetical protein